MRPFVLYILSVLFFLATVCLFVFAHNFFLPGFVSGLLFSLGIASLALGYLRKRLEEQTVALQEQMSALLGDGDIDINAVLNGGFGNLLGSSENP